MTSPPEPGRHAQVTITREQLQDAVQQCTERLWEELRAACGQHQPQPPDFPRYPRSGNPADRRIWPHDKKEIFT